MKRFTAILLSIVVLLSGGNIVYSRHFCGGKPAASKWTFGQHASCGMKKQKGCPAHGLKSNCCTNQDYKYEVDNYNPSSTLKPEFNHDFILIEFPGILLLSFTPHPIALSPRGEPPLLCPEQLCVFRI